MSHSTESINDADTSVRRSKGARSGGRSGSNCDRDSIKINCSKARTAGAATELPLEIVLPIYRAAHRRPAATTTVGSMAEELARPEALAAAIELDQLRLFYHPIVDLAGTSVVGHEVLIRWQHPNFGLLAPADFLPAIDRNAVLSRTLGAWVLRQSCAAAVHRGEQLHVSVNISAQHLSEPGLADHVNQILRVTGFPPNRLILELAETTMTQPDDEVASNCTALADIGVTLALDDLGINPLEEHRIDLLPLGILKIDRTVVAGVGSDPLAEQTIERIVGLAAGRGRRTIAVGVESHHQARFLREHDVTFAQGYLYGRPQPR
jgi:EAL domain-containing protein (putative c-di-GMP-specific phosphodiesterase class I)